MILFLKGVFENRLLIIFDNFSYPFPPYFGDNNPQALFLINSLR